MFELGKRPWGTWEILLEEDYCKVKRITVLPGQRLSYQSHQKRAEHWTVVEGAATVTLDDVEHQLTQGQSIEIPLKAKHRVSNKDHEKNLIFIEVQTGTYFGEDDIERFQDDYGRES